MLFDTFMFKDEDRMLDVRLEAFHAHQVTHVLTEAPFTHRGVPKPLHFDLALQGTPEMNAEYLDGLRVRHLIDDWQPDPHPWTNEHHQRNTAWHKLLTREAADPDWVLICDVDEIPAPALLDWLTSPPAGYDVVSVPMRTFLFAVDWEVTVPVPPACVAARAGWLRDRAAEGRYLAEVRDQRGQWPPWPGGSGGWHFSWVGGPDAQRRKLDTATCHTEILATPEAALIRSGERYRTSRDGGGLPVRPVTVDGTWPAPVRERRVPAGWYRPAVSENGAP